jgi:hypothetical protein
MYISICKKKRVKTDQVRKLKNQIGDSIANAKRAFANLNDDIMQQSSLDIEAEIETFERILTIDGLLNQQEIVMPEEEERRVYHLK